MPSFGAIASGLSYSKVEITLLSRDYLQFIKTSFNTFFNKFHIFVRVLKKIIEGLKETKWLSGPTFSGIPDL